MSTKNLFVVCCSSVWLLAAGVAELKAVSFQGLGDLAGDRFESSAAGVSADGSVVVGSSRSALGPEAFRWTAEGGMVGLGDLPGDRWQSGASAVSADGSVVVGFGSPDTEVREAFRWTAGGGMVGLGGLPGHPVASQAYDVSVDGSLVVGEAYGAAVVWTADGGIVRLVGLPGVPDASAMALAVSADGSVVVGSFSAYLSGRAFRWTAGGMIDLGTLPGGGVGSGASDVSADGSIVVGGAASDGGTEAFLWTSDDGMVGLGDIPGGQYLSGALGVSADGTVVVGWADPFGPPSDDTAFIWDPTHGMRNLKEVFSVDYGLDLTGWELTRATDVSDDGLVIVGCGVNPAGDKEAWRVVIPEPSGALLALSGLLALLPYTLRKRRGQ